VGKVLLGLCVGKIILYKKNDEKKKKKTTVCVKEFAHKTFIHMQLFLKLALPLLAFLTLFINTRLQIWGAVARQGPGVDREAENSGKGPWARA
jgi:fatty-acid desaturase